MNTLLRINIFYKLASWICTVDQHFFFNIVCGEAWPFDDLGDDYFANLVKITVNVEKVTS